MPESGLPAYIASCDLGLDLQESGQAPEACSTETSSKPSQITAHPVVLLMSALPFGGCPPLGRGSAELQVSVGGDIVLELVGFEEVAQLLDVVLVQCVHLLL